ncbi:MAG TPA: anion transporter, partial [Bryobacteraceae bacterium]|nr:anion transporter [Bryobacteraceae bacterium]
MDLKALAATAIFALTYFVLALGRFPGLRIDRTGAAVVGAALMVAFGVLSPAQAYQAIDLDTIVLLFGMMIVASSLRISGFFGLVTAWVARHVRRPAALLMAIVAASGVFSAFFVNDTICVVLTPLVCDVALRLKRNPVPYVLAVAMASNIGSTATITGNPQNMLIGNASHIAYREFALALAPVAAAGLAITVALLMALYRTEFGGASRLEAVEEKKRVIRPMLWKSVLVAVAMVGFFFAGQPVPKVAIIAGAVLLLTRRIKPERFYIHIDFPLLVMFAGLFVVVAGIENTAWVQELLRGGAQFPLESAPVLTAVTAVLSNVVSNVPAVLMLRPFVTHFHDPRHAWLVLAMASTLAGNFTIVASVANLIVVQRARQEGIEISFWEYFRA